MEIEKLKSGSYRIRKMVKGKRYSLVVDYKPGKREAEELINALITDDKVCTIKSSFKDAVDDYCSIKKNVLSPSTIRNYYSIKRNTPSWFAEQSLSNIDNRSIQACINEYSIKHSPKSVSNLYGLITAIMSQYTNLKPSAKLPMVIKKEPYIPTKEDVKKLMDAAKGTEMYVPLRLGMYGLRRSEIFALSLDDLDGNYLSINKSAVRDSENNLVIKNTTKTSTSTRTIYIDDDLADEIRNQGYVAQGNPDVLYKKLVALEKELGIPQFSIHKLRHYFATQMATVLPEADWLALGGWSSSGQIAKTVYRHNQIMRDKEMQQQASKALMDTIK